MKPLCRRVISIITAISAAVSLAACGKPEPEAPAWEKKLSTQTITIPGLKEEYQFLFLTDTHMIIMDEADSDMVEENAKPRYRDFKNLDGIPSCQQFPEWITYTNEEKLDGLLLGGDIIDYPSFTNISYLETELEKLEVPYLYTLGNHDWTFPWEYMTPEGEEAYLPLLEPYMKGDSSIHTLDYGEFVIAAVDNSANQVNEDALKEYGEILAQGKPVIVLVHVPFLTQSVLTKAKKIWKTGVIIGGGNFGGIYPNESSREFLDMTTAADSPVVAVLAGHVHFSDRDNIVGEKSIPQIVGDAGYKGKGTVIRISAED